MKNDGLSQSTHTHTHYGIYVEWQVKSIMQILGQSSKQKEILLQVLKENDILLYCGS